MTSGNPRHKFQNQRDTIENVQNLYRSRQKVINLNENWT